MNYFKLGQQEDFFYTYYNEVVELYNEENEIIGHTIVTWLWLDGAWTADQYDNSLLGQYDYLLNGDEVPSEPETVDASDYLFDDDIKGYKI